MHSLIVGEMKNSIRQVIQYHAKGSRSCTVGRGDVSIIEDNSIEYDNMLHIQYDAKDKDGLLIESFIGSNLNITYFRPKKDCTIKKDKDESSS
jgi:hypothetical protein